MIQEDITPGVIDASQASTPPGTSSSGLLRQLRDLRHIERFQKPEAKQLRCFVRAAICTDQILAPARVAATYAIRLGLGPYASIETCASTQ